MINLFGTHTPSPFSFLVFNVHLNTPHIRKKLNYSTKQSTSRTLRPIRSIGIDYSVRRNFCHYCHSFCAPSPIHDVLFLSR
jgi:hypothetical protein